MAADDVRAYSRNAALRDGTPVRVRAIRPDDQQRLAVHFARLSADSRYYRFFEFRNVFTPEELNRLAEPDFLGHVALVATVYEDDGRESIVGDCHYVALQDRQDTAEMAVSVIDDYQRRGIGTLLLEHMAEVARRAGIRRLEADVLASNRGALRFLTRLGFETSGTSGGVHRMAISMEDDDGAPGLTEGQPTSAKLRRHAYKLYLARGGEPGRALEDWLAAERELRSTSGPVQPGRRWQDDEEIPAGE